MKPAVVTVAELSDVEAIQGLVCEAYEPYIESIGRAPAPLEDDYQGIVGEGRALIARRAGKIVGLLITAIHPDHVLVENVAVAASEQGRGLGTFLLALADDQARQAGVSEVHLYTNEKMVKNIAFYSHRGFWETCRRNEDGFSRVFFKRLID